MISVNINDSFWKRLSLDNTNLWFKGHIYSHSFEDLLNIFKVIKHNEVSDFIRLIDGNFALVFQRSDLTLIAVDKIRSTPIFFTVINNNYYIDQKPINLINKKNFQKKINEDAKLELSMSGFTIGNKTIYTDLYGLKAGEAVIFSNNRHKYIQYHKYFSEISNNSFDENIKFLTNLTIKIFKKMLSQINDRQIIVPLSSGNDSRLVVSLLKHLNVKNVKCYTYGTPGNYETKVAKLISKKLGYDWIFIPLTYKSERKFFQSHDFKNFLNFSETFCSVPYIQSLSTIKYLIEKNWIESDAIFINGGAGDFISGGHINKVLNNNIMVKDFKLRKSNLLDQILNKHFSLWGNLKNTKNISNIKKNLCDEFNKSLISFDDPSKDHLIFEYSGFIDRQSKYVVNGQRIYEYYGYDWRLPLWDQDYLNFWRKLPLDHKFRQKLYLAMLRYNNFGDVWNSSIYYSKKTIVPKWVIPIRFICKIPFGIFGKLGRKAWKQFDINFFKYLTSIPHTWEMFNYTRVVKDIFKKPRNSVSWQVLDYLKNFNEKNK